MVPRSTHLSRGDTESSWPHTNRRRATTYISITTVTYDEGKLSAQASRYGPG